MKRTVYVHEMKITDPELSQIYHSYKGSVFAKNDPGLKEEMKNVDKYWENEAMKGDRIIFMKVCEWCGKSFPTNRPNYQKTCGKPRCQLSQHNYTKKLARSADLLSSV